MCSLFSPWVWAPARLSLCSAFLFPTLVLYYPAYVSPVLSPFSISWPSMRWSHVPVTACRRFRIRTSIRSCSCSCAIWRTLRRVRIAAILSISVSSSPEQSPSQGLPPAPLSFPYARSCPECSHGNCTSVPWARARGLIAPPLPRGVFPWARRCPIFHLCWLPRGTSSRGPGSSSGIVRFLPSGNLPVRRSCGCPGVRAVLNSSPSSCGWSGRPPLFTHWPVAGTRQWMHPTLSFICRTLLLGKVPETGRWEGGKKEGRSRGGILFGSN